MVQCLLLSLRQVPHSVGSGHKAISDVSPVPQVSSFSDRWSQSCNTLPETFQPTDELGAFRQADKNRQL